MRQTQQRLVNSKRKLYTHINIRSRLVTNESHIFENKTKIDFYCL